MQNPTWQGNEVNRYGVRREVTEHDLFRGENDQQDCLTLGKEVIQNSSDEHSDAARAGGLPARIVFTFGTVHGKHAEWCLNGLEERLDACDMVKPDEFLSPHTPYLLIEDFNTHGLIGKIDPEANNEKRQGNNFGTFWHWIGRTNKGEGKRGSKGLGKAAIYGSSQINAIIGMTIQETDDPRYKGSALVMGRAELKNHMLKDGKSYEPFVWFADKKDNGWWPFTTFAYPQVANLFRTTFKSERSTQPGFSIAILYPHRGITAAGLEHAAVNYWYVIQSGSLEVVIKEENGSTMVVNKDNIRDLLGSKDLYKHFAMLYDLVAARQAPHLIFHPKERVSWETTPVPHNLDEVKELAQQGNIIHVQIPVSVKRKLKAAELGKLDIILQKDPNARLNKPHVLREGLHISQAARDNESYRIVMTVESGPLANLLRLAENASHDNWSQSEPELKKNYDFGGEVIAFVKEAVKEVVRKLSPAVGEIDHTALSDFFSIVDETVDVEKTRKQQVVVPPGIRTRVNPCGITPVVNGGFTISELKGAKNPRRLKVRLKYAGAKKHNPNDFDLEDLMEQGFIDWDDCHVKVTGADTFLVTEIAPGFRVQVKKGFDRNRNLVVKATR